MRAQVVEFGRHKRLKISRTFVHAGSSPALGTNINNMENTIKSLHNAIITFHVFTVLNILFGLGLTLFSGAIFVTGLLDVSQNGSEDGAMIALMFLGFWVVAGLFNICLGVFSEFIIRGLKNKKRWAWIAGIVYAIFHIMSILFVPGILALIFLLDKEVSSQYKKA